MKTRSTLYTLLCTLMLGMSFTACSDGEEEEVITEPSMPSPAYILNEGGWGSNNAKISAFYHHLQIGVTTEDVYLERNEKKMGDLANALIEEDYKLYVVMNGSKYVASMDMNTREGNRYTFSETEGAPRCIDVEKDYAYVTQHGGQVSKFNIKGMILVDTFKGGDNLEGIVEKDGKLYVANAWKVDGSGNYQYNDELMVIDAESMTQTGSIKVVENPVTVQAIGDKIYVISQGNYSDTPAVLQVIDTEKGTSKVILKDVTKITKGLNGLIYGVRSTYDAEWNSVNSFFTYNPETGKVNEASFLQDAPSELSSTAIYLLKVYPIKKYIYLGTTDYLTTGTIYQFDENGKFIQSFDSGGVNPSTMIFTDLKTVSGNYE